MALDLGGIRKKKDTKSKFSIIEVSLFKPTKKKYPEIDYEEIRKTELKEDDSSGDDTRFHDREALELVRRLEAKYGNKKTKKGRKVRIGTEDDFIDKGAGYDLDDGFIDDSEAYDELIPSTMDTAKGGFYVNKGKLEFKSHHDLDDLSELSTAEDDPPVETKKGQKRLVDWSGEEEDEEAIEDGNEVKSANSEGNDIEVVPASEPPDVSKMTQAKPSSRMTGAPPTKKFRTMQVGSNLNQRAVNKIKKKMVNRASMNMPLMLNTKRPCMPFAKWDVPAKQSTSEDSKNASTPITPTKQMDVSTDPGSPVRPAPTSSDGSPKKILPSLTPKLDSLIRELKRQVSIGSGQATKKRLHNGHVDMVISIDEQCSADRMSSHEKSRVISSVAECCGIQKATLLARMQKRRDEKVVPEKKKDSVPGTSTPTAPTPSAVSAPVPKKTLPIPDGSKIGWTAAQLLNGRTMLTNLMKIGTNADDVQKLSTTVGNGKSSYDDFVKVYDQIVARQKGETGASASSSSTSSVSQTKPTPAVHKPVEQNSAAMVAAIIAAAARLNPPPVPAPKADNTIKSKVSLLQIINRKKNQPAINEPAPKESTTVLINELQVALKSLTAALNNSVSYSVDIHERKKREASTTGGAAPKFVFLFTEVLHMNLKKTLEKSFQYIIATTPNIITQYETLFQFIKSSIWPHISSRITLGKLCIEYVRRNPERCLMCVAPSCISVLESEKIDLSKIYLPDKDENVKKGGKVDLASSTKTNADDEDIQFLGEQGTSFAKTPSTSKATSSVKSPVGPLVADKKAPKPSTSSTDQSVSDGNKQLDTETLSKLAEAGWDLKKGLDPTNTAILYKVLQNAAKSSGFPNTTLSAIQSLTANQQATSAANNEAKLKAIEEKEKKKKEKLELKQKQILAKQLEQAERERLKKEKQEEKLRKIEEDRKRAQEEQALKEKLRREEEELKRKQEEEQRKRDEEKKRLAEEKAKKEEDERKRKQEAIRLEQIREKERQAEEERVRSQKEQATAARAAQAQAQARAQAEAQAQAQAQAKAAQAQADAEAAQARALAQARAQAEAQAQALAQAQAHAQAQSHSLSFGMDEKPGVSGVPDDLLNCEDLLDIKPVIKAEPMTYNAHSSNSSSASGVNLNCMSDSPFASPSPVFAKPHQSPRVSSVPQSPSYSSNNNNFAFPSKPTTPTHHSPYQMPVTNSPMGPGSVPRSPTGTVPARIQQSSQPFNQQGQSPVQPSLSTIHANYTQKESSNASFTVLQMNNSPQPHLTSQSQNSHSSHQNQNQSFNTNHNTMYSQQQQQQQQHQPQPLQHGNRQLSKTSVSQFSSDIRCQDDQRSLHQQQNPIPSPVHQMNSQSLINQTNPIQHQNSMSHSSRINIPSHNMVSQSTMSSQNQIPHQNVMQSNEMSHQGSQMTSSNQMSHQTQMPTPQMNIQASLQQSQMSHQNQMHNQGHMQHVNQMSRHSQLPNQQTIQSQQALQVQQNMHSQQSMQVQQPMQTQQSMQAQQPMQAQQSMQVQQPMQTQQSMQIQQNQIQQSMQVQQAMTSQHQMQHQVPMHRQNSMQHKSTVQQQHQMHHPNQVGLQQHQQQQQQQQQQHHRAQMRHQAQQQQIPTRINSIPQTQQQQHMRMDQGNMMRHNNQMIETQHHQLGMRHAMNHGSQSSGSYQQQQMHMGNAQQQQQQQQQQQGYNSNYGNYMR